MSRRSGGGSSWWRSTPATAPGAGWAAALLRALGGSPVILGGLPDGRYDHPPEPTETNLRSFAASVPAAGAVVGFAQDPDADRLALVDETGRYIGEELTLALAALRRLSQAKGPVVLNLSTSRVTEDLSRQFGCPVHRTPVGEIHVVERMRAESAILGGEGNGGVIDPRVGFVRDSFVAMALVLDLLAETGEPLSRLVDRLPSYAMVKDQYPLIVRGPEAVAALWDRISAAFPEAQADRRDGLRLDWSDRWAHVRSSNTEPIVRVIAEAAEPASRGELADQLGRWVTSTGGGMMTWPKFERPPAAAFVDVDGTLLAADHHVPLCPDPPPTRSDQEVVRAPRDVPRSATPVRPARLRPARQLRPEEHRAGFQSSNSSASPMIISSSSSVPGSTRGSSNT